MTEAEVLELAANYSSNAMTAFTIYISFTFAYLITAFYVGKKLTAFQVVTASGLYVVSVGSTVLAVIGALQVQYAIQDTKDTVLDRFPIWTGGLWISYMGTILIIGILISLYFMWNVRHSETE